MENNELNSKFKTLIFFSSVYLILIVVLFINDLSNFKEMKPNEWGDFFAGTFAPLAFLWLVFGYRQQGEELKQNTKAIELQALELHKSVEQQKKLVEATKQEFDLIQSKESRQIYNDTVNAQPFFHFNNIVKLANNTDRNDSGLVFLSCELSNSRRICREIQIKITNPNRPSVSIFKDLSLLIGENDSVELIELMVPYKYEFKNEEQFSIEIQINYFDENDERQFQNFEIHVEKEYWSENGDFNINYEIVRKDRSFDNLKKY